MIRMLLHFLFVLFEVLAIMVLVQAQDQSGFISIDCGLPELSNYTESTFGINYISDAKFIDSGVSKILSFSEWPSLYQQFRHVRSFPSGVRNCYRINVTSGTKYLIRATFFYGNYDGLIELPQFELHLGANPWDTVKFQNISFYKVYDIIHSPSLDYIHICLVNTGFGTPFISSIELRTLNNDTYDTQSGSLSLLRRYDLGNTVTNSTAYYRYKDDVYDRIWEPCPAYNLWAQLRTSLSNDNLTQNDYKPPSVVMSTAVTPINASDSFEFYWDLGDYNVQCYVYMHFTEVQKLAPNETREFNITLNGEFLYGPFVPSYKKTLTIYNTRASIAAGTRFQFSLFKTENSTLPPIINAVEIYKLMDFSKSETEQNDVDAITNIKKAYEVDRDWQGDPCTPIEYMWKGLNCSFDGDHTPPRITSLNLSSSGLTGQIASDISKLTMLQYLDLSNNSLSGPIPDFLTQLQSLKILNLENNNLTGLVPTRLVDRSNKGSLSLSVGQNPYLCPSALCNQVNQKKKNKFVTPVVALVVGILVLLVIASVAITCCVKKRKSQGKPAALNIHEETETNTRNGSELESKQRQYSFDDLVKITNNFDRILGRGGFGTVYHGFIDDIQVAVKILSSSSVQGYQQFVAEVKLLMRVHHRNLTTLIGYCNEETNKGLIYEYMANGNLEEHLSGKNSMAKLLTWEDRLRVAVDTAQGLEYLHNGCKPPIIHRDVKCTNILLSENMQSKLADFGLSKSFPTDGDTHMSTVVAGTPGYLDPEYSISNRLTEKSDVYSFGVVLLNIITSKPAIAQTHDNFHISQWVSSMLSRGDIKNIVDSKLQGEFDTNSVWKAVEIAMACVSTSSAKRPNMSEVVTELKECLAAESARKRTVRNTENEDLIEMMNVNLSTEIVPQAR